MRYKIIGLGSGGLTGLSHKHEYLFPALGKKHDIVEIFNTRLFGFPKYLNALHAFRRLPSASKYFHPFRAISSEEFSRYYTADMYYALKRAEACRRKVLSSSDKCDLLYQTTWQPAIRNKSQKPHFIFEDFTIKLSEREYPAWITSYSDKKSWIKLETKTYQNATAIFSVSDHNRESLINDYNIDEWKVITTYNGANLKEIPNFEKDYSNKTIIFVGIEFNRKGGPTLMKAFREVKKEIKDAKLVIVGSNPQVNIADVIVKGYLDHETTLQLYKGASVFAMPSVCEPFGITFVEAMAYKLPCIGTTVDAMPEIIEDGTTGFLVEPNKHKQLAEKLILLLDDEDLMRQMGGAGQKRVKELFTWDRVVERMSAGFDKFC
jgi:glycosyltransferase involved in cell wall biosynthesis